MNERTQRVNDNILLKEDTHGLTFGTDALLLAGYIRGGYKHGLEIGAGSGIISLLLLSRKKAERITAVEIQPAFTDLIRENASINGFAPRLDAVCADIRDYAEDTTFDFAFSNPPYMKENSGAKNAHDEKFIARHEVNGDIFDFCRSIARRVKYGGACYFVYRPDRLCDLFCAMRQEKIEPKRMTFVCADSTCAPSMVLVEGKIGASPALTLTAPLILYTDREHTKQSDDMRYILENGSFPPTYDVTKRKNDHGTTGEK